MLWLHENTINKDLKDYKFMCFNGKVRCSFVCSDRNSESGLHVTFFDREWNKLPFERHYPSSNKDIKKPKQYDRMIEYAEILSKDIPFVRTDFYEIDGHLYFGELTFYPGSGMEEFSPERWDTELGSWLKLPDSQGGGILITADDICLWLHPLFSNEGSTGLKDYKIHCFNGEPKITLVCSERFSKGGPCEDFFDNDWNHLDVREVGHPNSKDMILRPKNFKLMKELASKLSKGIPFVRTDFYEINGKVYFGEITFYPVAGFEKFEPREWERRLGEMIKLPLA